MFIVIPVMVKIYLNHGLPQKKLRKIQIKHVGKSKQFVRYSSAGSYMFELLW